MQGGLPRCNRFVAARWVWWLGIWVGNGGGWLLLKNSKWGGLAKTQGRGLVKTQGRGLVFWDFLEVEKINWSLNGKSKYFGLVLDNFW